MVPRVLFGDLNGTSVARVSVPGVDVTQAHEGQLLLSERGITLRLTHGGAVAGTPSAQNSGRTNFGLTFQELPLACIGFQLSGPNGTYVQYYQPCRYVNLSGDENIPVVVYRDHIEYPRYVTTLYSILGAD